MVQGAVELAVYDGFVGVALGRVDAGDHLAGEVFGAFALVADGLGFEAVGSAESPVADGDAFDEKSFARFGGWRRVWLRRFVFWEFLVSPVWCWTVRSRSGFFLSHLHGRGSDFPLLNNVCAVPE